jgi:glycosyltransferase involved in cell wall biosynthesis
VSEFSISICMPTYNGSPYVRDTIACLLQQGFDDFELIACDDASTDDTCEVISSFSDPRIRLVRNEANAGYGKNLKRCVGQAENDIVVLMGQDDIVCDDMLQIIHDKFVEYPSVGAITRAYFWFHHDLSRPVRIKTPVHTSDDVVLSIKDADPEMVFQAFFSMDQLSGLAMRREWITHDVHPDIFTAHIYPMASLWKEHDLLCLKDNTVAVRIESSQARYVSSIYDPSPVATWVDMFNAVYPEAEFDGIRGLCIRQFVARNYLGLAQIRNYGKLTWVVREVWMLVKHRPANLLSLSFWAASLGVILCPPFVLIRLVDWYKKHVLANQLPHVQFDCSYTPEI